MALNQVAFRLRNDDGNEFAATWYAAANTNIEWDGDGNLRVRFLIDDNASEETGFVIQENLNAGGWNDLGTVFVMSDSPHVVNGIATTQQLGVGDFADGRFEESDGETITRDIGGDETEDEFCFANSTATAGDSIQLRVRRNADGGGTALDTYTNTPTITIVQQAGASPAAILMQVGC